MARLGEAFLKRDLPEGEVSFVGVVAVAEELAADKSGFVIVVYLKKVKKTSADAARAEGLTPEQVKQSRIELKGGIVIVGK